jgi:ATP-dependent Clp protease ATP-binding subunit ClpC
MKVDVVTVRRLVNRGELAAYRIGGEYRFKAGDIRDYLERQYVPAQLFKAGELANLNKHVLDKSTRLAKQSLLRANEEASAFGHAQICPEHILLGLILAGDGVAFHVLDNLGVKIHDARKAVEAISGIGAVADQQSRDFSDEARALVDLAVDEAKQLKHHYVGTEHLLLALTHDVEGNAARVLAKLGLQATQVQDAVLLAVKLGANAPRPSGEAGKS